MSYTLDETELAALQALADFAENAFVGMQDNLECEMAKQFAWVVEYYINILLTNARECEEREKQEQQ